MPVVPMARNRVAPAPLPGTKLSPDTPTAAFQPSPGVDFSGATKVAQQIVQDQQQKDDQVAVLDADNQLSEVTTNLTQQALSLRGTDALGATKAAREGWEKAASDIESNLTSPRAKEVFRQRAAARWQGLYETTERHAASESRAHDDAVTKAAIGQRYNAALTAATPDQRDLAFAELRAIIADHGRRNGETGLVQPRIAEAVSRTHAGILTAMLTAGNDQAAARYYADKKAEIQGDDRVQIEKALEVSSTLGEAQRLSDAIITTKGITRADAFDKARAIEDPKIRQAAERNLDVEFSRRDRAEADQYEKLQGTAYTFIEQGRRPPAPMWAQLKPSDKHAFDQMLKTQAKGENVTTDLPTYYALKLAAVDPARRDEFAKTNLLQYVHKLSKPDFEELVNAQVKAKSGAADPALHGYLTTAQTVDDAVRGLGLKSTSPEAAQLRRAVDDEILSTKQALGKKDLPTSDVRDIVDRVVMKKVFIDKAFQADPSKPAGLITPDEKGRAYVPLASIPEGDANRIREIMRANAQRPSDDVVQRAYAASLIGDRKLFDSLVGTVKGGSTW